MDFGDIYLPSELFEIIIFDPDLYYYQGLLRLVCKTFAKKIPATRRLPNKKARQKYPHIMAWTEIIKQERIENFIKILQTALTNFTLLDVLQGFPKWLLRQNRNIRIEKSDEPIKLVKRGRCQFHYPGCCCPTFPRPITEYDKKMFKQYNRWLMYFENNNYFLLNHDMFGYPACTRIKLNILPDKIVLEQQKDPLKSRHKSRVRNIINHIQ